MYCLSNYRVTTHKISTCTYTGSETLLLRIHQMLVKFCPSLCVYDLAPLMISEQGYGVLAKECKFIYVQTKTDL